jgi:hypothetical protein
MMFGRVEAIASQGESGGIHITVYLESGRGIRTVRDECVPALNQIAGPADLAWTADQYAQETIANELAIEGWEVIGAGSIPEIVGDEIPRSAAYAVRRLAEAVE